MRFHFGGFVATWGCFSRVRLYTAFVMATPHEYAHSVAQYFYANRIVAWHDLNGVASDAGMTKFRGKKGKASRSSVSTGPSPSSIRLPASEVSPRVVKVPQRRTAPLKELVTRSRRRG